MQNIKKNMLTFFADNSMICLVVRSVPQMRKCRNWQTSKTKDLVAFELCGFKSHLPHLFKRLESL